VSQNQHAVDVVRRKLIDQMGIEAGLTVLGSEQGVSPEVKSQIKLMLSLNESPNVGTISAIKRTLKGLTDERRYLENQFELEIGS
jgi:hypothetical protein